MPPTAALPTVASPTVALPTAALPTAVSALAASTPAPAATVCCAGEHYQMKGRKVFNFHPCNACQQYCHGSLCADECEKNYTLCLACASKPKAVPISPYPIRNAQARATGMRQEHDASNHSDSSKSVWDASQYDHLGAEVVK